jgi:sugar phosphate isomerase/epimerase
MARLAISELTTLRWSFEEDIEHYRSAGVAAMGVWRHKLADVGVQKGAELLASAGIAVSSLQWAGGFTGSDGHTYEESLHDARQAIVAARTLRAGCLIVHSGARGVHTRNHARRIFSQALEKLIPLAEEHNVTLAIEPMHGDCGSDFTFLNCLDETLKLLTEFETSALALALDTYYWGHHPSLLDRLPKLAPRLALVQLGDSRCQPAIDPGRCQLGAGKVPLAEIVRALTDAGYKGYFEVELTGEEIEAAGYHEVLSRSIKTFQEWTTVAAS